MRYLFPTGKGYQRKWLGQDVLSGVVIAAVSIPISMGYAQIAGLPAVYGLYGSLLPVILFALLSTSPQFIFGVDAAPAAMIGGVLGGMGIAMGSAEAERVVPVLTFYVGIWLLLFALLRAGRVLRFVSTSVMGGFISGICCTIILMQLPKLMGGTAGTGELPELVRHLAGVQVHPLSLGLGAAALVILLAAKRLRPKFPMAIVVMGLGALATVLFDLPGHGVACLGAVEPGLPALHLPDWSAVSLTEGLGSSLPVAVVIMAETLLAESSFAMRDGYEIRDSQELLAFAAANLGAGMVGCCPVNGSVSRSSMNVQYRGKTQAVSLVAAAGMAAVLLWGSGLIRLLPVPVLTAIVISALLGAVEFDMAHRLLRADRKELAIFLAAFLGVLVLGTIYGVVIGVLLSFVDVIRRASQPSRELLGVISGQPGFYPLGRMSQAHPLEGVALYRFSGGLFFANIDRFQKDVENCVKPGIRAVIVDASGIVSVDLTSAERLVLLYRRLEDQGVRLYLTEHIGQVNDELRRFGAGELIEEGAVRRTLYAALEDCGAGGLRRRRGRGEAVDPGGGTLYGAGAAAADAGTGVGLRRGGPEQAGCHDGTGFADAEGDEAGAAGAGAGVPAGAGPVAGRDRPGRRFAASGGASGGAFPAAGAVGGCGAAGAGAGAGTGDGGAAASTPGDRFVSGGPSRGTGAAVPAEVSGGGPAHPRTAPAAASADGG